MFGTFIDLGKVLAQKLTSAFTTKQGIETPKQRPISTQGDSFDFFAGFKQLLTPKADVITGNGVQVLDGATSGTSLADNIFNSLGRNLSSSIDKLFGNAQKIPSVAARNETNNVREQNSLGTAGITYSLGDAFRALSGLGSANPNLQNPSSIPQQENNNNLLIIGGFLALGAVLLLAKKGRA
jgi:hypothetical protein